MRKILWIGIAGMFLGAGGPAMAAGFGNEVLYQIITDRFEDGDSGNNCGQNDPGLSEDQKALNRATCDPAHKDWNKYWGGDLEGIRKRADYLKALGITQIWISPVIENARGFAVGDGALKTAYHGFWGRDWFRFNEHWTAHGTRDAEFFRTWVADLKAKGIGVILDTVLNHTSPAIDAEYGALYEDGKFLASAQGWGRGISDEQAWFHAFPSIRWDLAEASLDDAEKARVLAEYEFQHGLRLGRMEAEDWPIFSKQPMADLQAFMLQNFMLADLADLSEANPRVADYLARAHERLLGYGIAGFRVDTVRHMPQSYFKKFIDGVRKARPELPVVGEWYGGGPGNAPSMEFVRNTGMTIFDFVFRWKLHDLFLKGKDLAAFSAFLESTVDPATGRDSAQDLVTFIDNHDMPRMQAEGAGNADILEMMKLQFAVRGVPCIYYGLENFLFTTREGGKDPYNRDAMVFAPIEKSPGQQLLRKLSEFRLENPVLRFGNSRIVFRSKDWLVLERSGAGEQGGAPVVKITVSRTAKGRTIPAEVRRALEGLKEVSLIEAGRSAWSVRYYR